MFSYDMIYIGMYIVKQIVEHCLLSCMLYCYSHTLWHGQIKLSCFVKLSATAWCLYAPICIYQYYFHMLNVTKSDGFECLIYCLFLDKYISWIVVIFFYLKWQIFEILEFHACY